MGLCNLHNDEKSDLFYSLECLINKGILSIL